MKTCYTQPGINLNSEHTGLFRDANRILDIQIDNLIDRQYLLIVIEDSYLLVLLNSDGKENIVHRKKGSRELIYAEFKMEQMKSLLPGISIAVSSSLRKAAVDRINSCRIF